MDRRDDVLPRGWVLTNIASVGEVRLGRQRSPDKHTGRYPCKYLRAANITPEGIRVDDVFEMDFTPAEREKFMLRAGDVVLTEASGSAAHVGRAAIWQGEIAECCYQNTVIRFRSRVAASEYALTVFRHYAMSGKFAEVAHGVGIQHLGATRLANLEFPLPPVAEQRRIAIEVDRRTGEIREARTALLTALDNIVEQNKQILATAIAGELVESEVSLAKSEGRAFEDGWSLLARVANDESDQLTMVEPEAEISHTGNLPLGWAQAQIGDVGEASLGKARGPQHQHGAHMRPYMRVANVYEDYIDTSSVFEMNFSPDEYDKYTLRHGDILLNDGQSPELVGRPAMYRDEVPGACFQNHLIRFRAGDALVPEFALLVFRHYLHAGTFKSVARWTTNIATLSRGRFSSLPMPVPPLEEQRRIVIEARRRLDISNAQESDIRAALERLPVMETELLAAAVEGALVPQNDDDEPASELLTRKDPIQTDLPAPGARTQKELNASMPSEPRISSKASELADIVREAGRPLPVPELFRMAGYDRDSAEDVELFYLALRTELGRSLRQVGDSRENDLLEAIADAVE